MDHRARLALGVIDLHLQHLEFILQRRTRLLGGFDRVVVRCARTVHPQRVSIGRRFISANDLARLVFFGLDARLLNFVSV